MFNPFEWIFIVFRVIKTSLLKIGSLIRNQEYLEADMEVNTLLDILDVYEKEVEDKMK